MGIAPLTEPPLDGPEGLDGLGAAPPLPLAAGEPPEDAGEPVGLPGVGEAPPLGVAPAPEFGTMVCDGTGLPPCAQASSMSTVDASFQRSLSTDEGLLTVDGRLSLVLEVWVRACGLDERHQTVVACRHRGNVVG